MQNHGGRRDRQGRGEDSSSPTDRLPPHSEAGERAVLGWCLIRPKENIPEAMTRFGSAGSAVFYDPRNRLIYELLCRMQERGEPVDLIPLMEGLAQVESAKAWITAGPGRKYVVELLEHLRHGSPAGLEFYAQRVWEDYLKRRMLGALEESATRIYGWNAERGGTEELLDGIEAGVLAVNQQTCGANAKSMKDLVMETNEWIESIRRGVGIMGGIRTHFGYFDKMTGGLHRGELGLLAARPSVGKTSLMMNWAVNIASRERVPVAIFSMEMSARDLALRARCAESGVNFHKLRTGFATDEEMQRIMESSRAVRVSKWPIWIDDTPALGILELRARARRLVYQHGIGLVMVDYTQLGHGVTGKEYRGNREREVADISSGMKAMARELDVAVLALSQLNREVERSKNRKPQLSDLRDSGALEQDADLVGLLYRPKTKEDEDEAEKEEDVIAVNMEIAKQRNGPCGPVEMIFTKSLMQMEDAYQNKGMRSAECGVRSEGAKPEPEEPRGGELPSSEDLGLGK